MANITRIKAKDETPSKKEAASSKPPKKDKNSAKTDKKPSKLDKKQAKIAKIAEKNKKKAEKKANRKPLPKALRIIVAPFVFISKPFRAFGRYVKASWVEIRQVRWPDRKLTWKMTFSVIIYVVIFATVIMLLDAFFSFAFNKLLGV